MKKALCVGINKYNVSPLNCCINDAIEVCSLLSKHEDDTPNYETRLVKDIENISCFKDMISKAFTDECESIVFYYSGHGYVNEYGGYLVTPDIKQYNEGVSMAEIMNIVNKSKSKNKIIILDCCNSGNMASLTEDQNTSIIKDGVTILTSSLQNQASVEKDNHGLFTKLLINALKGEAADICGDITPGSIYSYIDKSLGAWEQRPMFKTNISKFISLRKVKPQVPANIIRNITKYFNDSNDLYRLDPSYEYTNSNNEIHLVCEPYAKKDNVVIFKELQKLQSIGLVKPVNTEYMYFAAMESKECELTPLGKHYWNLVKRNKI